MFNLKSRELEVLRVFSLDYFQYKQAIRPLLAGFIVQIPIEKNK